jgi:hypothetical protein
MRLLIVTTLILFCTACAPEEDRCVETATALGFDDPSAWGPSPADLHAHVEGERSGTITWLGGGEAGELEPATGAAGVSVDAVLAKDSAIAVEREHVGGGRLTCVNSIEMTATVTIISDDGALSEQIEVALEADDGSFGAYVSGQTSLATHDFAGAFTWTPASPSEELLVRLSWTDDANGTLRGWLVWADPTGTSVEGDQVTIAGSGRLLAEFEAVLSSP